MTETTHTPVDMGWLLEQLAVGAPGILAALVTSNDGLPLHQYQLGQEAAERISAIVSGAASLGRGLDAIPGLDLPPGGSFEQVVMYHSSVRLMIGRAGDHALLAVVAHLDADMPAIGYAMDQLASRLSGHLGTSVRQSTAG
ncbi:roadblock/LC7 domain-containing protein [Streptomyces sp. NPDC059247]|uniref:roadblock/LC7 domain-containing protein n=1 Tax=Streptomyces sp. NPDC059247 TaxID=3346790 RepID=UPI0036CCA3B6